VEHGDAAGGLEDGLAQVCPQHVLEEIPGGAGGDRRAHLMAPGEAGEDEDTGGGRDHPQAPDGAPAPGARGPGEGHVQQHDVRAEGAGEGHGVLSAGGLADQVQVGFVGQEGA
jgi:hypothetical protein